jgi:hypothetical protein
MAANEIFNRTKVTEHQMIIDYHHSMYLLLFLCFVEYSG